MLALGLLAGLTGCEWRPSTKPNVVPPVTPVVTPVQQKSDEPPEVQPSAEKAPAENIQTPPSSGYLDGPPEKPPVGRPRADRTPTKPGEAEKITFDDLIIGLQADIPFRPWMLEGKRPQELEGKLVRLSGLMHGGAAGQKNLREFVLLRNTECKFGPGGQADHLARIFLADDAKATYTNLTLIVEGTLKVEPFEGADGNTWAIYRLDNAKIR